MNLVKNVKFREEKFGGVLFETRSEKVFTLNRTGAAVLNEIAAGSDEKSIVEQLKGQFDKSESAIEREVLEFIAVLRQKGLVEN